MRTQYLSVRRWASDRRAAVALIFGLSALPVIGLVGLAVDFGFAAQAKSQLALVADTAAMQAVTTAANVFKTTNDAASAVAQGRTVGQAWFAVQAGGVLNTTVDAPPLPDVQATTNQVGNGPVVVSGFKATVTYTARVNTFFAQLFGITTIAESGTSQATVSTTNYVDVTFLLDNSSSMTMVANQADISTLQDAVFNYNTNHEASGVFGNGLVNGVKQNKPTPCAFACHWTIAPGNAADGNAGFSADYYGIAKRAGIQVRFDVLQQAVTNAVQTMINNEAKQGQFGIGVFEFNAPLQGQLSGPANSSLYEVYPNAYDWTSNKTGPAIVGIDLNAALTAANGITTPVSVDYANTLFGGPYGAMQTLSSLLPPSGSGATADSPQQALIIITDGIEDFFPQANPAAPPPYVGIYNGRQIPGQENNTATGVERPFLHSDCDAAKAKGVNVFVIYTTYFNDLRLLPYGNPALSPYLSGNAPGDVVPELTACATSPSNFIEATNAAAINVAVQTFLLAALRGAGRFSQ